MLVEVDVDLAAPAATRPKVRLVETVLWLELVVALSAVSPSIDRSAPVSTKAFTVPVECASVWVAVRPIRPPEAAVAVATSCGVQVLATNRRPALISAPAPTVAVTVSTVVALAHEMPTASTPALTPIAFALKNGLLLARTSTSPRRSS